MPIKKDPWQTYALVIPDVHIPYHDKQYWKLLLDVASRGEFDTLVIMGDFVDFYSVSQYRKDPRNRYSFKEEVKKGNACLDQLDKLTCFKKKIFIEGNHENRLERLIFDNVPALVDFVDFQSLLNLKKRGYQVVSYRKRTTVGQLILTHDIDFVGRTAVHRNLDVAGDNIGVGHTHHLGIHYASTAFGKHLVSATFGNGLDISKIDYKHQLKATRDWPKGFGTIRVQKGTGTTFVEVIPVIRGKCVVGGVLYGL